MTADAVIGASYTIAPEESYIVISSSDLGCAFTSTTKVTIGYTICK